MFDEMYGFAYTDEIEREMQEMILAFVPESEYVPFSEAVRMMQERSNEAADLLMNSILEGDVL